MAINVNTVYRTVLLILNKEQRGYLTPDEFNKTATQVQLEIFNEYFEDLNQQLRVAGNDSEYSNRIKNLEEKIAIFQTEGPTTYNANTKSFAVDTSQEFEAPFELYKLGTVIYQNVKEVQYVQPNELLEINLSPITRPSKYWPIYVYKNYNIYVYPTDIVDQITCTYLRKPVDPIWNFTLGTNYQYIYNPSQYNATTNPNGSQDFELSITEQTNLIIRILLYAGVVIKDPQIVQVAAQQIQNETVNSKS
jgi:hypothetical protein